RSRHAHLTRASGERSVGFDSWGRPWQPYPPLAHPPGRVGGTGPKPGLFFQGGRSLGRSNREVGSIRLKTGMAAAVIMTVLASHPSLAAATEAAPAQVASRIDAVRAALSHLSQALDDAEQNLIQAELAAPRHQKAL